MTEPFIPSERRGRGVADWENAKQFESVKNGEDEWVSFFDQRPDVLHAILGDIYITVTYDERKRATGKRLDGRRVMPRDANLAALEEMITPRYSMEPFALAVKELIGERSLRQFASRVPMDHRELSRMMRGECKLTMYWLEQIAVASRVTPHFFAEYRQMYVVAKLTEVFSRNPNLSVGVVKKFTKVAANGR